MTLLAREPLLEALARRGETVRGFARTHGLCVRHVHSTAGLTWGVADKWAVALGMHPAQLWGFEWWTAAHEDARTRERRRAPIELREPAERFCGRPLVSPRWDPLRSEPHVCASDGCPEHRVSRDEAVA